MSYLERMFVPTGIDFTYFSAVHDYVKEVTRQNEFFFSFFFFFFLGVEGLAPRCLFILSTSLWQIKSKRQVMMTGHSLGGSVAQVVGAKEALPAITYSAPGIVYSRR